MIHGTSGTRRPPPKMSTDPALIKKPEQPHQDRMTTPSPTRGTTRHREHQASSSRTQRSESKHRSLLPAPPPSSPSSSTPSLPPPGTIYINPTTTHRHHLVPPSHHHHHQPLRPLLPLANTTAAHLMDPNRYPQGGYYPPATTGADEADASAWAESGQSYEEFNNTLMMHPPDTIIDDPSWYTDFDYSADPAAYWDTSASGGYDAVAAVASAGGSGGGSSSRKGKSSSGGGAHASSSSSKGKSKGSSSPPQGGGSGQVEYRFKTDLPEAADWEAQKSTIKELYLTEKRSLRDVTEIMKDRYGFYATERMYKHQFKKWNWHKYKSKDRK